MALQSTPGVFLETILFNNTSSTTANATGESAAAIGQILVPAGSGTLSSSGGGYIIWHCFGATYANAGSIVTVGLQGVNTTTNVESGTFLVSGQHTTGGTTITQNQLNSIAMDGGSLTINHGDLYAGVVELTNRGGSDFIQIVRMALTSQAQMTPWATQDAGGGPSVTNAPAAMTIVFDDGSFGYWGGQPLQWPMGLAPSTVNPSVSSTPDEYAAVFSVPVACEINAIGYYVGAISGSDAYELILYSDPEGTPSVVDSVAITAPVGSTSSTTSFSTVPITATELTAGTLYAVAVRPTTAGAINIAYADLTASGAVLKSLQPFSTCKFSSRTNQTGAFSEVDANYLPIFHLNVSKLDDGAGGGGGGTGAPFSGAGFIVG